jgi:cytochrome oxidase Cu insertion factor (SCO1/SenC/PrrC family)
MRHHLLAGVVLALTAPALAQGKKEQRDEDFLKERPAVGDPFPTVTVYLPNGKETSTATLRGHYTVLTFGCLT